jgi:hypothetical protein
MKIKEQAQELQALLNATKAEGPAEQVPAVVDDIPDEIAPEPLFDIDYNKCKSGFIKKARMSIKKIVRAVISNPEAVDMDFVRDKIEQDAEQLGNLYYQQKLHELTQQSGIESVRTGNVSPRMIEVIATVGKNLMDISKQIADFQISIKDNYAKIKFDAIDDRGFGPSAGLIGDSEASKELEDQNIYIGSKNLNRSIQEQKRAMIERAQEAKFEEVK